MTFIFHQLGKRLDSDHRFRGQRHHAGEHRRQGELERSFRRRPGGIAGSERGTGGKRKKKSGKRKNFKKCVIFKKKSPANTLFTGLFLVPVAGVEPARVLAQRILSFKRYSVHRRIDRLLEGLNGTQKASIFKGFEVFSYESLDL